MSQKFEKINSVNSIKINRLSPYFKMKTSFERRMSFQEHNQLIKYNNNLINKIKDSVHEIMNQKLKDNSKFQNKKLKNFEKLNSKIENIKKEKSGALLIPILDDRVKIMTVSKDFKGFLNKCLKLNLDPMQLFNKGQLQKGTGCITQIHQFKGIGYIQLDSLQYVRFHRIDFRGQWWLVTVAYALKTRISFLYSSRPVSDHQDSKELFLVDYSFFHDLRVIVNRQGISKTNYFQTLDRIPGLPYVMQKFLNKLNYNHDLKKQVTLK